MNLRDVFGTLLKAVLVGAFIYAVVNWQFIMPRDDEVGDLAETVCFDEISRRFDASTVSVYSVNESNNGYIVRASVTLTRGPVVKVYCLTNAHGGVREITIEER